LAKEWRAAIYPAGHFSASPAMSRIDAITMGLEIPPRDQQTPGALGAYQKAEIEKWWPIIKAANIKGE